MKFHRYSVNSSRYLKLSLTLILLLLIQLSPSQNVISALSHPPLCAIDMANLKVLDPVSLEQECVRDILTQIDTRTFIEVHRSAQPITLDLLYTTKLSHLNQLPTTLFVTTLEEDTIISSSLVYPSVSSAISTRGGQLYYNSRLITTRDLLIATQTHRLDGVADCTKFDINIESSPLPLASEITKGCVDHLTKKIILSYVSLNTSPTKTNPAPGVYKHNPRLGFLKITPVSPKAFQDLGLQLSKHPELNDHFTITQKSSLLILKSKKYPEIKTSIALKNNFIYIDNKKLNYKTLNSLLDL